MDTNFLTQVVEKPTRTANNGTANILDLIITNRPDAFREFEILPTAISDHAMVSVILSDDFKIKQNAQKAKKTSW